jgi:RNA polymerase-binding protein
MGEAERGETAPRIQVTFFCANGHVTQPSFASDAVVPEEWDCPRCGLPASRDEENPPPAPRNEPYKTHLAYVKERRSDEDGAAILEEALEGLRKFRGES